MMARMTRVSPTQYTPTGLDRPLMTQPPARSAADTPPPGTPASVALAGQHAFLLSEVNALAGDLLTEADRGAGPTSSSASS